MKLSVKDGVVINENGEIGVLYSRAYRHPWNNIRDKRFAQAVMFYPPLVLFLAKGGDSQDLVIKTSIKLTEKGMELTRTLFHETVKESPWLEDLRWLSVKWVPQGKKIRITDCGGYEKIECYDEIPWIDIPCFSEE